MSHSLVSTTVILLCGLPASGKSSLARKVKAEFDRPDNDGRYCAIHLEYDDFEESIFSQQAEKDYRDAWNQARELAMHQLENIMQQKDSSDRYVERIILMDDNFHLRGMRKQIHRMLLQYKPIKFGLLWMKTSADECLERNRHRQRRVPESVITKMESTFEPPRSEWESCWLEISEATPLVTVADFIRACAAIADLTEPADTKQQGADREKTLHNQRHNWDKLLRSWVGLVAKNDKSLARGANEARKKILLLLKDSDCNLFNDGVLLNKYVDLVVSSNTAHNNDALRSSLVELLKLSTATIHGNQNEVKE